MACMACIMAHMLCTDLDRIMCLSSWLGGWPCLICVAAVACMLHHLNTFLEISTLPDPDGIRHRQSAICCDCGLIERGHNQVEPVMAQLGELQVQQCWGRL
jgi:hypothetical protein